MVGFLRILMAAYIGLRHQANDRILPMAESTRAGDSAAPAKVDASYRPFAAFSSWGRLGEMQRDLWSRFSAELEERKRLAAQEQVERAVMVAVRAAAIDTGAIEGLYQVDRGFTMSVAVQAFAWEHALAERGEGVRELFEAQLSAYEFVIGSVTGRMPVSEAWLRSLHECICSPQKTYRVLTEHGWQDQDLPLGRYKETPNHVLLADGTFHAYAPVAYVVPEMHRFMEELRSQSLEGAHPVEQAAYAHYALTAIHPFADGNGRVARALASLFLYRSVKTPLVIFAHQRPQYLDSLEQVDRGNAVPWLVFVADRSIDTMQLVTESLRSAASQRLGEIVERLDSTYGSRGRTQAELDNLAFHLLAELQERCARAVAMLRPKVPGSLVERGTGDWPPPAGYRRISSPRFLAVTVALRPPAPFAFTIMVFLRVNIALDDRNPFGFQLETLGSEDRLDIRDEDAAPEISGNLKFRMDLWIERQVGSKMLDLERQIKKTIGDYA
jgi:Fic family protein